MADLLIVSDILSPTIIESIRSESAAAEKSGRLTSKQLDLVYENRWLSIMVPSAYDGRQLSLPDVIKLEEALSYADGSLGWLVTLCAGAGWFGGFLDAEFAKTIFADPKVCMAGSGAATAQAERKDGGYIINGKWQYASGAPFATVFTANCIVYENGQPLVDEKGKPVIQSFCFLKKEVVVKEEWNAVGMIATSSHSFEVKNLYVDEHRVFNVNTGRVINSGLYYFPFLQLSEATLAANMLGMGAHFLELTKKVLDEKYADDATAQDKFATMAHKLNAARQKLYYGVDMAWQVCNANKDVSQSMLYKVSAAAYASVTVVKDCVNVLFPYCGLRGADRSTELNRVWRDIQTAGQHSLLVGAVNV